MSMNGTTGRLCPTMKFGDSPVKSLWTNRFWQLANNGRKPDRLQSAASIVCWVSRIMCKHISKLVIFRVFCAAVPVTTQAASFIMYFEVTGFPASNGNPPPTDPVTVTIVWEAAGIHDPIQSFDSINMTLDSHTYSVDEIGIPPPGYPMTDGLIGGTLNQVYQVVDHTDDFWVEWNQNSLTPFDFAYSSSQRSGIWFVSINNPVNFTAFSITEVPEPSAIALFSLGLLGTGTWWFRRAKM
jgi:hypothetical protein